MDLNKVTAQSDSGEKSRMTNAKEHTLEEII